MNHQLDYKTLQPDNEFLVPLGANVWLMDDHKWALLVWERHRKEQGGSRYPLVHADFHWDGVDNFSDDEAAQAVLLDANLDALEQMTRDGDGIEYDSFIAAAVRRGLLSEVHFYCLQEDGTDVGLDAELCQQMGVGQFIHEEVKDLLAAKVAAPFIFDLCLDLFNGADTKFGEGALWPDKEILEFVDAVAPLIRDAELVTVSLSFDYSGTEDDTRHLAVLVIPAVLAIRSAGPAG